MQKIPPSLKPLGGIFLFLFILFCAAVPHGLAIENPLQWPVCYTADITVVANGPPSRITLSADGVKFRQENSISGLKQGAAPLFHRIWIVRPDLNHTYVVNPKTKKYLITTLADGPPRPDELCKNSVWQIMEASTANAKGLARYRMISTTNTPRDNSQDRLPWERLFFSGNSDTCLCWVNPRTHSVEETQDEALEALPNSIRYEWKIDARKELPASLFEPPAKYEKVDGFQQLDTPAEK